jgi:hypothetical protein
VLLQADADLSPEVSSDLHEGLLQCLLQLSLEALSGERWGVDSEILSQQQLWNRGIMR